MSGTSVVLVALCMRAGILVTQVHKSDKHPFKNDVSHNDQITPHLYPPHPIFQLSLYRWFLDGSEIEKNIKKRQIWYERIVIWHSMC